MEKKISKLLKLGENIEIEIDNGESFLKMKSTIISVINDNRISIAMPIYKGKIYPIATEEKIDIVFNKMNKGKFYFTGEVVSRMEKDNIKILLVKKISDIKHFQRRDFFRLNIVLNMDLEVIENGSPIKTISAISKDISGGGIRVITKEKLSKHTVVKCIIKLDNDVVEPFGKVIRCAPQADSIIKYDVGICFTTIDESIRSKIISFIFKNQRKLRKKGLI
ncbi:flagellar brake protein [Wukongibacter sp. M2B1]|uniref:flagellar brake protein n=1 Tax=Wukongibacter sp. M2B1 TaxID=3088895 RepID=UPI003D7B6B5C